MPRLSALSYSLFRLGFGRGIAGTSTTASYTVIQTFTATSTWTCPEGVLEVEYLVVAGGGGGGAVTNENCGGGGAGGYRTGTGLSVTAGTDYTITVGSGGPIATQGQNSVFSIITSTGGGSGGQASVNGGSGGSGGGGGNNSTGGSGNTPSTSPAQGTNGGNGFNSPPTYGTGGGGGASQAGISGTSIAAGNGGSGALGPSFAYGYGKSGDAASGAGNYFAGGGGGSANSGPAGAGGTGGGGAGSNGGTATSGATNSGGGGGGSRLFGNSGAGGSGIVILKYTVPISPAEVVYTFKGTTTWTCPTGVTSVDYLVVAGGGSGGGRNGGGGGGAGGFRTGTGLAVIAGTDYTVTVGAGGPAPSASNSQVGNDGQSSTFSTITSAGGGGGGNGVPSEANGRNGGSGGGAGGFDSGPQKNGGLGNTPSTSPSQGNNGGSANAYASRANGAGGGGASAAGNNNVTSATAPNYSGGTGGNGTASTISGSSVTYAGGGGGGTSGTTANTGGSGGGGSGGLDPAPYGSGAAPTPGTENTGGGGGGAAGYSTPNAAGKGGSGIVIIKAYYAPEVDPYFEYTSLLLSGNGTNGAQNNTFLDSGNPAEFTGSISGTTLDVTAVVSGTIKVGTSITGTGITASPQTTITALGTGTGGIGTYTVNQSQNVASTTISSNGFPITRNGNPTQGTFSPFSQTGWGVYFDGNNDNCTSSTALFNYTTGNASTQTATVEAWVYLNAYAVGTSEAANPSIAAKGSTYMNFGINPSGNLVLYWYDGATKSITSSGTVPLNTWVYVAFTLSGGTATLYINGSSSGSGSWTGLHSAGINSTSYFGNTTSGPTTGINGYLSNLRVSTTARSISTPTSAFSNDGNTAFLSFQSNRFVDNSSNTYAITPSGNTSVQAFSPFNPSASWSAATYGGSGYFDGNGDYLSVASNAAFTAPSDFTVEFWAYTSSVAGNPVFYLINATNGLVVYVVSSKVIIRSFGVADLLTSNINMPLNQWVHIAAARSGTTMSLWINGSRTDGGTVTNSTSFAQGELRIGSNESATLNVTGYISNVRFVKGTAVYDPTSSTITVPTAPLTAITNTSLLLNYTNAGIYDATSKNDLETVDGAQISTAISAKWGSGSMLFDGTGDYLFPNVATADLYAFGSGAFTIEFWIRFNVLAGFQIVYDSRPTGTDGFYPMIYANGSTVSYYVNAADRISSSALSTNTWYHVAVSRSGTSTKLFIDGTQSGSTYTDSTVYINPANRPIIGANGTNLGGSVNGYIQDLRVTKGIARYTANFTAPTAAFKLR